MEMVKDLIGLSGKMTSGKTSIAELLVDKYGYVVLPIAGRIKKVSNLLIEDQEELLFYLNQILPKQDIHIGQDIVQTTFDDLVDLYFQNYVPNILEYGMKEIFIKDEGKGVYLKNKYYRDLTQRVGKCIREKFGSQVWVEILLNEASLLLKQGYKVICDDVRLRVESEQLSRAGFTMIRLDVDQDVQKERILRMYETLNPDALTHHTETELDRFDFKYRFDTSKDTKENTFNKVENVIKEH